MGLKTAEGYACPNCGLDHDIVIQMRTWYHVHNDTGVDDDTEIEEAENTCDGPYSYDDTSGACCWKCEWQGTVADLTTWKLK